MEGRILKDYVRGFKIEKDPAKVIKIKRMNINFQT